MSSTDISFLTELYYERVKNLTFIFGKFRLKTFVDVKLLSFGKVKNLNRLEYSA